MILINDIIHHFTICVNKSFIYFRPIICFYEKSMQIPIKNIKLISEIKFLNITN
jgi:hypothetical protein